MTKILAFLKKFFLSNKFKTFCWLTLEGFLTLVITELSGLEWAYAPLLMAVIANIIKFINQRYLQRIGFMAKYV